MMFDAALVDRMLGDVLYWLEEVRQDVCNVQSDVAALREGAERMRAEVDRLRAEVAQMKARQRFRELAAQEAQLVRGVAGTRVQWA